MPQYSKLGCLVAETHFDPSFIFVGRAGGTPGEALMGLHSIGRLLV
jgi:hypothetical protein